MDMREAKMSDKKNETPLKHGDYPMPDGRTHHVLEVQNGFIDVTEIFKRIEKKHLEESNG